MQLIRTRLFEAKAVSRHVRVTSDNRMSITVRLMTWWWMGVRYKEGRSRVVSFPLGAIASGWYRPARWWRLGALCLDVPGGNDPWQYRTDRQRKNGTFPRPKQHQIVFTTRQQPAFELCAREIGVG